MCLLMIGLAEIDGSFGWIGFFGFLSDLVLWISWLYLILSKIVRNILKIFFGKIFEKIFFSKKIQGGPKKG